jgi:hypothetical protein
LLRIRVPQNIAVDFSKEYSVYDLLKQLFDASMEVASSFSKRRISMESGLANLSSPLSHVKSNRGNRMSMPASLKLSDVTAIDNAIEAPVYPDGSIALLLREPNAAAALEEIAIEPFGESTVAQDVNDEEAFEDGTTVFSAAKPSSSYHFQHRQVDRRATLSSSQIRQIRESIDRRKSLPPSIALSVEDHLVDDTQEDAPSESNLPNIQRPPNEEDSGDADEYSNLMADEPGFTLSDLADEIIPSDFGEGTSAMEDDLSQEAEQEESEEEVECDDESDEEHENVTVELRRYDRVS